MNNIKERAEIAAAEYVNSYPYLEGLDGSDLFEAFKEGCIAGYLSGRADAQETMKPEMRKEAELAAFAHFKKVNPHLADDEYFRKAVYVID